MITKELDYNWLFSTISQSFAAIVGLIGAFIISKIITNQTEYKNKISKLENNLIKSSALLEILVHYPNKNSELEAKSIVASNCSLFYCIKNETEYSKFLKFSIIIVIIIFILGVFVPLLYIPTNESLIIKINPAKLIILLVSIATIVFFSNFIIETNKLKYNTKMNKPIITMLSKLLKNEIFLLRNDEGISNGNNDIKRTALIKEINTTLENWKK